MFTIKCYKFARILTEVQELVVEDEETEIVFGKIIVNISLVA
jgi:hypothetical protein